jgi:hypothetical protein
MGNLLFIGLIIFLVFPFIKYKKKKLSNHDIRSNTKWYVGR